MAPFPLFMTQDWSQHYRRLGASPAESDLGEAWLSAALSDLCWDDFLRSTPCGQFQQSSLWAEYKAGEGWQPHRVILTGPAGITGGFQILWKKTRLGRIGYVSKGPVAAPESTALIRHLGLLLADAAKELGLIALIAQPPDETHIDLQSSGQDLGFIASNPMDVIEATYLVDVRESMEVVRSRMSQSLRRNIRKAHKLQAGVREGTEADLPRFFDLMAATCRRQKAKPNPANVEAVRSLWRIFSRTQSIRVTFAECGAATPATLLALHFGNRVTLWKKGWDGGGDEWHPNELITDESMAWAQSHGFQLYDFGSIPKPTARQILSGKEAGREALQSREGFSLRFGGFPKLLPSALVLLPSPLLRWGYRHTYARIAQRRDRHQGATAS